MPGGDGQALLRTVLQPSLLPDRGLAHPGAHVIWEGRQGTTTTGGEEVPLPSYKTPDPLRDRPFKSSWLMKLRPMSISLMRSWARVSGS